jgi:hypothetical protein
MRPGHGIVTPVAEDGGHPIATMKPRFLVFPLCLLACTSSAWAQNRPGRDDGAATRPLNLSLPRDTLRSAPPAFQAVPEDTAVRNLRQETRERERQEEREERSRLPYGTGYEARQQGMGPSPAFGGGQAGGAAGMPGMGGGSPGGHGGGMGRGR